MNLKRIRWSVLIAIISFSTQLSAQNWTTDEYKAEIGANVGGSFCIGEANYNLFAFPKIAFGGFFRYKLNTRLALKADLYLTSIAGNAIVPNKVYVGDLTGEFNFFDLEKNSNKRYSKIYSPYIFTGLTLITDVYQSQKFPEFGIPFGVGIKVKLTDRMNFNAQWTNRLMFVDNLEGTAKINISDNYNNPSGLNGSNIFNNDLLSTYTVGLSIDVWKKQCDCRNLRRNR